MSDNKSRDIFYGVVAIATLIVALVGATLAYFSMSVSSNEGAVNATAKVVSIDYSDGQEVIAQADQLIPATLDVVKSVYESDEVQNKLGTTKPEEVGNVCLDRNNQQVCSIFRFSVKSTSDTSNIVATLNSNHNGFKSLAYAVRDVNNNKWLDLDTTDGAAAPIESQPLSKCDNTNEDTTDDCYKLNGGEVQYSTSPKAINSIFGYGTAAEGGGLGYNTVNVGSNVAQTYDVVIFIKESGSKQDEEQGQKYNGTLIVEVTDGNQSGKITGCADESCVINNQ